MGLCPDLEPFQFWLPQNWAPSLCLVAFCEPDNRAHFSKKTLQATRPAALDHDKFRNVAHGEFRRYSPIHNVHYSIIMFVF